MKILITGGAGFIAGYFCKVLLSQGHKLVSIDLGPPSIEIGNVSYHIGDIRNYSVVRQLAENCDAVLHLAAAHHDFGIDDDTFVTVNVEGTKVLCQVMDELKISKICFFSTVAVYGENATPPISEETSPNPTSPYGRTKFEAEKVLKTWCDQGAGRASLIIRPTVTFGPENFANMYTLIRQIDRGLFVPIGAGTNIKSLSYVENIVVASIQLWLEDQHAIQNFSVFNFIDKPDLTSNQIVGIIYDQLGKKPPAWKIPYGMGRLLALPFDAVIALTGWNLPISGARIKKLARSRTQYESDKIFNQGIEVPVPLEEGIRKMCRWYLEHGKKREKEEIRRSIPPKEVLVTDEA